LANKTVSPDFLKEAKILLVEDNELNQLLAIKVFEKWSKKIDVVDNGKKAIEKIEKTAYDIILLDIQMPEMDGIELTKYIRSNMGEKSRIPIIALTAHATVEEERKCLENGMNDYLSKPYDFDVLLNKLYLNLEVKKVNTILSSVVQKVELIREKLVDLKYLKEFAEGDETFIKEMVSLYLENTPETMEIILKANANNDIKILKLEIHKLKSSLSLLGMVKASQCVDIIEKEIEINPHGDKRIEEVIKLNEICKLAVSELQILVAL
jgi:CheY-like chemotaxis protein